MKYCFQRSVKHFIPVMTLAGVSLAVHSTCLGREAGSDPTEKNGKWQVEMHSKDIGIAETVFTFQFNTRAETFKAHTRKRAVGDILPFWKALGARIFTGAFKRGALFNITDGIYTARNDSVIIRGILRSAAGNYVIDGRFVAGVLTAELSNGKGQNRGYLRGERFAGKMPLNPYPDIIDSAVHIAEAKIYSPEIPKSEEWTDFKNEMKKRAPKFQDDAEMVFAFFYYARKLPFSHFAMMRKYKTPDFASPDKIEHGEAPPFFGNVDLNAISPETGLLKISSFAGSSQEIDSVFSAVRDSGYVNLIVDLRNNSGGASEAGMAFASNVTDTALTGGLFLTRNWFEEYPEPPPLSEYNRFPRLSKKNTSLLIDGIHREKGIVLEIIPSERPFRGNLYILINGATASTCELVAAGLQAAKRATLIGTRTAGAMLTSESFELQSGFELIVPTGDYYTAGGFKIDGNGVEPDINTAGGDALDRALIEIAERAE